MVVWYAIISKVPSHLLYCLIFQLISEVGDIELFLQMRRVRHAEVDLHEMMDSPFFWLQDPSYLQTELRWDSVNVIYSKELESGYGCIKTNIDRIISMCWHCFKCLIFENLLEIYKY